LDSFIKGKMFKDNYVIAGMSKQAVLNIPFDTKGYAVIWQVMEQKLGGRVPSLG
jgi:hypothetical protein